MVGFIDVPPVFDFTVFCFNDDNALFGFTDGKDEKDFVPCWYIEKFSSAFPLD